MNCIHNKKHCAFYNVILSLPLLLYGYIFFELATLLHSCLLLVCMHWRVSVCISAYLCSDLVRAAAAIPPPFFKKDDASLGKLFSLLLLVEDECLGGCLVVMWVCE